MKQAAEVANSVADFEARLAVERARAARGGHPLSLLSLEFGETDAQRGTESPPVVGVARSLRSTDVICQADRQKLEILLPFTGPEDASRLVARVGPGTGRGTPQIRIIDLSGPPAGTENPDRWRDRGPSPSRERVRFSSAELVCEPDGILSLLGHPLPRWKRALDILLSSVGLLMAAPVLVAIAIAVKVTSPGPVIFKQLRTGRNLRRFPIYKFRTMLEGADRQQHELRRINEMSGPLFKSDSDPRLTPVGRLLRHWSLDELPQLVNVLRGEMTLLGPRALSPLPSQYEDWQLRRFTVMPGVACTWQASRRAEVDFAEWMRSDLEYIDRGFSLRADLRLLVQIVVAVIRGSGAR